MQPHNELADKKIRLKKLFKNMKLCYSILRNNLADSLLHAGEPERNSRNRGVIYPVCDF